MADYILRLVEQISRILAGIIHQKRLGRGEHALAGVEQACLEQVGLPLELIKQASPEQLLALLRSGGDIWVTRSLILAELLREEAEICELRGNAPSAALSYAHASRLIVDALPFLNDDEKRHFEILLDHIESKRRDLG